MTSLMRRSTPVVGLGVVLAALVLIQPNLRGQLGLDSVPNSERTTLVSAAPDVSRVVQNRQSSKHKVIDRLLAQELTLVEAAAWFRYLNDNPTDLPSDFRSHWPSKSDGEKACRQVISWVDSHLSLTHPESQIKPILAQLERELDGLLAETGSVELPW